MRKRPGEKQDPWLLIKSDDEAARSAGDPDILEEKPRSVVSKRTIEGIEKAGGAVWESKKSVAENVKQIKKAKTAPARKSAPRKKAKKTKSKTKKAKPKKTKRGHGGAALPAFVQPQLADLHDTAPDNAELRARGKVRRLSPAGAARQRQGEALDAQGARLGAQVRAGRGRGGAARCRHRADRWRGRGRAGRPQRFLVAAGRAQEQQEQFRLLRVRPAASRRRRFARSAAHRTQGCAERSLSKAPAATASSATASTSRFPAPR